MGDAGRARHRRPRARRHRARAAASTGSGSKYEHELRGLHGAARHDPGRDPARASSRSSTAGTAERRHAAALYLAALDGVGDLLLPPVAPGSNPVWHLFVVRTAAPDALGAFLDDRGIQTGRHYPHPVHLSPAYARLGHERGSFPVAESVARDCLSLPLYPGIGEEDIAHVVRSVEEYFAGG